MVIQQQGYPKYVGPQISPGSRHSIHDETAIVVAAPPTATAVRVIKENDSIRNKEFMERKRSTDSPVDKSAYCRRSPSPESPPPPPVQPLTSHLSAFEPIKLIKRSNSIDNDDPMYDADSDDQSHRPIEDCEPHDMRYDSKHESDHDAHDEISDIGPNQDNDAPLDLSLSAGRRRDRTYSGTESDDSGGVGDEKAGGKAAYKKSLMKRYCK